MTPKKFKENRKKLGFTQKTLAYELSTNQRYICQFEKGVKILISKKLISNLKALIADSAFMKASHNIKPMVIDKNMFRVAYEDV